MSKLLVKMTSFGFHELNYFFKVDGWPILMTFWLSIWSIFINCFLHCNNVFKNSVHSRLRTEQTRTFKNFSKLLFIMLLCGKFYYDRRICWLEVGVNTSSFPQHGVWCSFWTFTTSIGHRWLSSSSIIDFPLLFLEVMVVLFTKNGYIATMVHDLSLQCRNICKCLSKTPPLKYFTLSRWSP